MNRVVITNVFPEIEKGRYSIKRCIGDTVIVEADLFTDGHTDIIASLLYRKAGDEQWQRVEMESLGNDRWQAAFMVTTIGKYFYKLQGWQDRFGTWQHDLKKKGPHRDISKDLKVGIDLIHDAIKKKEDTLLREKCAELISKESFNLAIDPALHALMKAHLPEEAKVTEYETILSVVVEPVLARFSSWYELFPRSCSLQPHKHGTFKDCLAWLPRIAKMGFDIVYLPPIHPIGTSFRKGKNNSLKASHEDPGSPWAIGAKEGGHTSIHPLLGSEEAFNEFVSAAKELGLKVAMDIAFQCSPDHPYLKEHPEWFSYQSDGTIKHAENPPKKYEDIVPFNFDTDSRQLLWEELLSIIMYWIKKGIRCFRVDNPHTKPFAFWQWLIEKVKEDYPEVLFLSEAFTRQKVMHWLAKVGFSQSYTYFTWRYTKKELMKYVMEITEKEVAEYFRPNFWPNTPDILPYDLQYYGKPAFMTRLILAATLSSSYGVYGPPYEQMVNVAAGDVEEYLNAEKYEIKMWDQEQSNEICDLMTTLNAIRKGHEALQKTDNIQFYETGNSQILYYTKSGPELLLIVVNLDPEHTQSVRIDIPYESPQSYRVHELLEDRHYIWEDTSVEISIDPNVMPARIYKILTPLMRETKFEYYM